MSVATLLAASSIPAQAAGKPDLRTQSIHAGLWTPEEAAAPSLPAAPVISWFPGRIWPARAVIRLAA